MSGDYVYIIGRMDGPIKVGVSKSPMARLDQLQTGCPFRLDLIHVQKMRDRAHALEHERAFMEVWQQKHLCGEWFDLDADLAVEQIETSIQTEEAFSR